ncbi:MAG: tRNA (adenosine(37)-N6)-dimethylallyltransferase MiaA [Ruminococcaceae bacterium]|nr:tRNA (adenosine(37)-N6)-dimethylallyltransferase MiaA [Oscillospiraceae bacterium]
MNDKIKIAAIVGPTAGGKTALAVEVAKRIGGEIICCDSMQIYEKMMIGSAAPTEEERQGVPHHLFGFVPVEKNFSAADYVPLARAKIEEITARGKLPILCGGTGLYLESLMYQSDYSPAVDPAIRESLEPKDVDELHAMLCELDPVSAEAIHKNNKKRVIRALEICIGTGKPKSEWDALSRTKESIYDARVVVLSYRDRETLYDRINRRVDMMFDAGLIDEVKSIDFPEGSTAGEAIGYKELRGYLKGEAALEDAANDIKQATRNYAKRQITWFKREKSALSLYVEDYGCLDDIVNIVLNHLTK